MAGTTTAGPTLESGWRPTRNTHHSRVDAEIDGKVARAGWKIIDQAVDQAGEELIAHAFELGIERGGVRTATRKFWVGSWDTLEERILRTPVDKLHFHELLRHDRPCRALGIDLDFERPSYRTRHSDETIVTEAVAAIVEGLKEHLGVDPSDVRVDVFEACSSAKFSYHLLFDSKSGDWHWRNNAHCGRLVLKVIDALPRDSPLYVTAVEDGKPFCVVDTGVYSHNHTLRMYRSTKPFEFRPLLAWNRGGDASTPPECPRGPINRRRLRSSWITWFPETFDFGLSRALEMPHDHRLPEGAKRPTPSATSSEKASTEGGARKRAKFRMPDPADGDAAPPRWGRLGDPLDETWVPYSAAALVRECVGDEAAEELYAFHTWKLCRRDGKLRVNSNCQRCGDGKHEGNHSQWVVNLRTGFLYRRCYSQKCGRRINDPQLVRDTALREKMRALHLDARAAANAAAGTGESDPERLLEEFSRFSVRFDDLYEDWAREALKERRERARAPGR